MVLTHEFRIEIIYDFFVHGKSLDQISQERDVPLDTVTEIVQNYSSERRTNRLYNQDNLKKLQDIQVMEY